jgi:hypothetical protein
MGSTPKLNADGVRGCGFYIHAEVLNHHDAMSRFFRGKGVLKRQVQQEEWHSVTH